MKPGQVLSFIAGVFALMGVAWVVWPSGGIPVFGKSVRFASLEGMIADANEEKVDVDAVLGAVDESFVMKEDTLSFYRDFFLDNPNRIYLPGDDYTFFDGIFSEFERARRVGTTLRVAHYGDSQIEMDRISSDLRDALQSRFGGIGTGMFPALSNVPSASILRSASGGMIHYTMYGDTTTVRAPHRRYGVMAQLTSLSGGGTISLRSTTSKNAYERTKSFSRVSLLVGRNSEGFSAKFVSDTIRPEPTVLQKDTLGAVLLTWTLPRPVTKASLTLSGSAEIYGVMADGNGGVAVDNIPLRGCSGTIFTRIDKDMMKRSFAIDGTRLIILQFGGNFMPVAGSEHALNDYLEKIALQIQYFHEVAPKARILFIGPSDMGKSVGGRIVTWPRLPQLVEGLKRTSLENGAAFWDLYGVMGGENSMVRWVKHSPAYAGADYIHFTSAGAKVVGEALSKSFLIYYDFYNLRKTLPEADVRQFMQK